MPSVSRNISRVMLNVEAGNPSEPRFWDADDIAKFGWHLYIVDEGAHWCGANNPIAIDGPPLGFGSDDRLFGLGLRRWRVRARRQNPSPTSTGTEPLTDRLDAQSDLRALERLRLADALMFTEESSCASQYLELGYVRRAAGERRLEEGHESHVSKACWGEQEIFRCYISNSHFEDFVMAAMPAGERMPRL
jgi:hypothetical protein